jgi:hypothetical protein
VSPYAAGVAATKACLDLDVAAGRPPKFMKPLLKRHHSGLCFLIVGHSHQHADAPHLLGLLRPC